VNIILFGPPGAGKGTQAQLIVKKHNYFQLSTGDLLRNEIKKNTDLGKEIEEIISRGNFASDKIVNKLLKNTILNLKFRDRIIFDGYPRTIEQAKNLDLILNEFNQKIDLIISLIVPRQIIEKRIIGRVTCDKCNLTLNEFFNKEEIDLHPCGKEYFIKRKDDNLETIMSRYDIYTKTTEPVLNFLSKNLNFHEVDGTLGIDEITAKIDAFINV
jgi:adenylate kinase